ncbi:MAG: outer membrane beta-barrel protein [Rhodopseudomonas palustris]|uniref:Outer membrane beta-barrel protein n=1 Tax=Rhodopseudomonas palustris TaxID=1076 RepID=A0A933S1V1_RHOPL|nr:outer membrane beta-barrel protein [Rhodopseudomonas palustris]
MVRLGLLSVAVLAGVSAASAQSPQTGPYLRLGLGGGTTLDANVGNNDSQRPLICGNALCTASGSLSKTGSGVGLEAAAGYQALPWLGAELAYTHLTGPKLNDQDAADRSFSANITTNALMANAYVAVPGNYGNLRPYVGGGVGVASVAASDVTVLSPGGTTTRVFPGATNTNFAYQAFVGTEVSLTDVVGLDMQVRYTNYGDFSGAAGRPTINGASNPAFASSPGISGTNQTVMVYFSPRFYGSNSGKTYKPIGGN